MNGQKVRIRNKKAYHDYEILEELEAGLVLQGSEVKSLREGRASLQDAYCRIEQGEVFLIGAHIPPYKNGGYANHEPRRKRKLLLHKHQIRRLENKVTQKGLTLVPLELYFRNGYAKVKIALVQGRKKYDKREAIKKREAQRTIERAKSWKR